MDRNEIITMKSQFDAIAHHDDELGIEFWYARELQLALGYSRWENFEAAITRAKTACKNSKIEVQNHFRDVTKMVQIGSGTTINFKRRSDENEVTEWLWNCNEDARQAPQPIQCQGYDRLGR